MENILKEGKKIFVFKDESSQMAYAVDLWKRLAKKAIDLNNQFVVGVSGGKTPKKFFSKLAKEINIDYWKKTFIFFVDERFVPLDDEKSNYNLVKKTLLRDIKTNVYPFYIEKKDIYYCIDVYESKLKEVFNSKNPSFDLLFLGIGTDGHTASLFTSKDMQIKDRLLTVTKKETENFYRMSFSLNLINNAKNIAFLVNGENKAEIIKEVCADSYSEKPAAKVLSEKGNTLFLLDENAAAYL